MMLQYSVTLQRATYLGSEIMSNSEHKLGTYYSNILNHTSYQSQSLEQILCTCRTRNNLILHRIETNGGRAVVPLAGKWEPSEKIYYNKLNKELSQALVANANELCWIIILPLESREWECMVCSKSFRPLCPKPYGRNMAKVALKGNVCMLVMSVSTPKKKIQFDNPWEIWSREANPVTICTWKGVQ